MDHVASLAFGSIGTLTKSGEIPSFNMLLDVDFGTFRQIGEFLDGEEHGMHLCLIPTEAHTYALMNTSSYQLSNYRLALQSFLQCEPDLRRIEQRPAPKLEVRDVPLCMSSTKAIALGYLEIRHTISCGLPI